MTPDAGPVLVTGATGGVGSTAVDILAALGYEVVACTGKDPEFLLSLGAAEVISREDAAGDASRPLEKSRWAGAVDCVGGEVLAGVIRGLQLRRRGRGLRQHRRRRAAHDRAPVHPARRLAARHGFGSDADRGAPGDLAAARDRSAPAAPRGRDRARDSTSTASRTRSTRILAEDLGSDRSSGSGASRRATSSSRRNSSSPWPTASSSAAQNSTSDRPSRHRSSVSRRPASPESSRAMVASSRALAAS